MAAILKDLTGGILRCASEQILRAAFLFPNKKGTNYPWDNDKMCLGKDWFSGFLKINGDMALKKPGLSRARAQGLNNRAVDFLYTEICVRHSTSETNLILFSIRMRQGFR